MEEARRPLIVQCNICPPSRRAVGMALTEEDAVKAIMDHAVEVHGAVPEEITRVG